ncbi:hypothetical protein E2C01_013389 [Portunus trituberculatus]|uniref:Uncharacterized protein n=1 Tax=Portunus trituberculatus TaxID=210409 RepID=A0A5B7DH59_PORTR|nr:hypothetical protein [Portunus trituberculatus]
MAGGWRSTGDNTFPGCLARAVLACLLFWRSIPLGFHKGISTLFWFSSAINLYGNSSVASFRVLRRILQGLKTPEPLLRRSSTSGSRLTTCLKAIRVLVLPGKGEGKTRVINTSEAVRGGGLRHGGTLSTTKLIST